MQKTPVPALVALILSFLLPIPRSHALVIPKSQATYRVTGMVFLDEKSAVVTVNPLSNSRFAFQLSKYQDLARQLKRPRFVGLLTIQLKVDSITDEQQGSATFIKAEKFNGKRAPAYDSDLKELR